MGDTARSEVGAAVDKNRGLAQSARRFVRAPQTETRLWSIFRVKIKEQCDALSSEQGDYDLEGT